MIPSNKVFLPPRQEYDAYLDEIWESGWVTNNGELLQRLERELAKKLDVSYVRIVANGTLALQLGLRALDLQGEILTTPFSYVATTSALVWENDCHPVFVDVEPDTFNFSSRAANEAITDQTCAMLPTHVFGVPCDVEPLQALSRSHDLPVLYDGAHAFGTEVNGTSVFQHGDLTAISFHATKLFHTVEGGAVVTDNPDVAERIDLLRAFGHQGNDHFISGINAKNSELHAAMGLCLLPRMDRFIRHRRSMYVHYKEALRGLPLQFQTIPDHCSHYNAAYFPILLPSDTVLEAVQAHLEDADIYTRRYFRPSLNQLPYIDAGSCPNAEDIASRVLCLPFFQEIDRSQIDRVASAIHEAVSVA